jgi:hypothetical protein
MTLAFRFLFRMVARRHNAARGFTLAMLSSAGLAGQAGAQTADSAAFIVRVGRDTTAIERFVRVGNRIDAVGLSRSPTTVVRRYTLWLTADGAVERYRTEREGAAATEAAGPHGGAPLLVAQFYLPWEVALMRAVRAGRDSLVVANGETRVARALRRTGTGEVTLMNQFDGEMRARIDDRGRVLSIAIAGGSSVERVRWLDFDGLAREYASRDAAGRGLGILSPRDSTMATVGNAAVLVDYSRPSLRGRTVESLAPAGAVWRTGANNATTLRTSQPLRFGNLTVPAGTYSLFTIPNATGWTLIVNRQTGQSGLDHDPAQDLGRVPMQVRQLSSLVEQFTIVVAAEAGGGVLRLQWGRTEAFIPFRVGS